jgi:surface antigen
MKSKKIISSRFSAIGIIAAVLTVGISILAFNLDAEARIEYYYTCSSEACKAAEAAAAAAKSSAASARSEKTAYQGEVAQKQSEIAAIQAEIDVNKAEIADLDVKIEDNEAKLNKLRDSVKRTIAMLYVYQDVSGLELLASSDSVVDFTARQTNQEVIQSKMKRLADETKVAKAELETQQKLVREKKQANEDRRSAADAIRAEMQQLADEWAGKEAEYNQFAKEKEAERAAAMTVQQREVQDYFGGPGSNQACGGGYPYCGYKLDGGIDPWGMYYRECVSYTAFKVSERWGKMPLRGTEYSFGGRGNANEWVLTAKAVGIPTGSAPKVHSVGVSYIGYYGHVVWIESISGNTVYFSDYNRAGPGMYGTGSASASAFEYIYFGDPWK